MSERPPSGVARFAADGGPLISDAIRTLSTVEDRGIWFEGEFTPWSESVAESTARAAVLRDLLGTDVSDGPPHVGVLLENTPEYLHLLGAAAISEIVVAGLNPTRAGAALARDVATADCGVVLTDAAHAHLFEELDLGGVRVLRVDTPSWRDRVARAAGSSSPGPGAAPTTPDPGGESADPTGTDDLVCLVFTSGTSGDPKAVRVTQGKIAVPGRMLTERFGITRADRIYSAMPLFHSNAVMVAWPMAAFAGTSIVLRRRFSASGWLDDVRRYGCTFANYVGAPLTYILATPERPDDADNPMRVVYGNEAPADVRERFAARFGVTVVDGFGSTEGGVAITRTPGTPPTALGPLPDGVRVVDPVDGTERPRAGYDDAGAPVAGDDVVGELVADGRGLFAGYYGDPAADAERMRGGRFRTGDLAYVDEAGFVYFAGRSSGWMRVDGENLAAAPIERVLQRHPAVDQVAVYAVPAAVGDAVMAAVVLTGDGGGSGRAGGSAVDEFEAGFADFLDSQPDLGPKQHPSYVRVTDELPRTASFKVRTRDLTTLGVEPGDDRVFALPGGVHLS